MTEENDELLKQLKGLEERLNAAVSERNELEERNKTFEEHQQQQSAETAAWKESCGNAEKEREVRYLHRLYIKSKN